MLNASQLRWIERIFERKPRIGLLLGQTAVIVFLCWYGGGEIKYLKTQLDSCQNGRAEDKVFTQRLLTNAIRDLKAERDTAMNELRRLQRIVEKK